MDLILEFLGLSGQQPGLVPHLSAFARAVRTSRRATRPAGIRMYQGGFQLLYPVSGGRAPEAATEVEGST